MSDFKAKMHQLRFLCPRPRYSAPPATDLLLSSGRGKGDGRGLEGSPHFVWHRPPQRVNPALYTGSMYIQALKVYQSKISLCENHDIYIMHKIFRIYSVHISSQVCSILLNYLNIWQSGTASVNVRFLLINSSRI